MYRLHTLLAIDISYGKEDKSVDLWG